MADRNPDQVLAAPQEATKRPWSDPTIDVIPVADTENTGTGPSNDGVTSSS